MSGIVRRGVDARLWVFRVQGREVGIEGENSEKPEPLPGFRTIPATGPWSPRGRVIR